MKCLSNRTPPTEINLSSSTIVAILSAINGHADKDHSRKSSYNYVQPFSRGELDSHANMVCLGKHCTVINWTHRSVKVNGFSQSMSMNHVPVVDAVVAFDDPYADVDEDGTYYLVFQNALYIPSMKHHLIPPFVLREAGLEVNETPKRQAIEVTENNHTIYDPETKMRIHMSLNGIFSSFDCRKMTTAEMETWREEQVVQASPGGNVWNPYDPSYAEEEASCLNHRGEVRQVISPARRKYPQLIEDDDDNGDGSYGCIQAAYADPLSVEEFDSIIEENFASVSALTPDPERDIRKLVSVDDPVQCNVSAISRCLNEDELAQALEELDVKTAYGIAAGSAVELNDLDDLFVDNLQAKISEAAGVFSSLSSGEPQGVTADKLAKIWRISEEDAQRTIETTTQLGRYSANTKLTRELTTSDRALRYKRFVDSIFFTDTMQVTGKAKSTRGYTHVQVYVSDKGFIFIHFMTGINQKEYLQALKAFCREVGVPDTLVCDPHPTQHSRDVKNYLAEVGTRLKVLERSTQWADLAERFIGLLKSGVRADLRESNAPMVLWDFCLDRRVMIMNLTARTTHKLRGINPYTATTFQTADISNIATFGWFEWVYFLEDAKSSNHGFPKAREKLGRCLGPSKDHGNEMCQWVLKENGYIVPLRTLRRLTPFELSVTNETERDKRLNFMNNIRRRYGDAARLPPNGEVVLPTIEEETSDDLYQNWLDDPEDLEGWHDEDDGQAVAMSVLIDEVSQLGRYHIPEADICDVNGVPISDKSLTDLMIGIEVALPHGEEKQKLCRVLRRSVDNEGKTTGVYDENPQLNTMIYDVMFEDGKIQKYAANIIAQNVLEQVDNEGNYSERVEAVIDHRRQGNAVSKGKMYVTMRDGRKKLRQSTAGWDFKVRFSNGREQWMQLKDLKEINPVEVAEYVAARGLSDEVAFQWWVPYTLRKKSNIICAVKGRAVKRKTHKYGVQIPQDVEEAFELDDANGNTLWQDALAEEVSSIGRAIRILPNDRQPPPGYTKASGHCVFDVKMCGRRKARWVKNGHLTPVSDTPNYAGVVSRESVRIAFTYAAMMGLPVMAGDIKSAYLQAPTSEKHYIVCGREFGLENMGKKAIITGSVYGGRVSGRDYWLHLRKCMNELGFTHSLGDADVWYRPAVKKDGTEYYEYVLLYVDDVLVVSENAEAVIRNEIGRHWEFKESSIEKPSIYLGGKCREVELDNGVKCWAFGSSQYVQEAVKNVETWLGRSNRSLPRKAEQPFKPGYRPELDVSRELNHEEASYYQSLIGILRWIVELGRVDMNLEVSMMSSHLALPREGHLECLYHMFAYLKKYHNAEMVFDPTEPVIAKDAFKQQDWTYSTLSEEERKEKLPPNAPGPRGKGFVIRCYVDADHAGDSVTRKSRTGFMVYLNNAPVYWYSKKQGSVEPSTYQAEFTAMREATEYVRALRYKLRMMGIPVEGPAYIFGDNQSVLANTTNPGSTLKKKCAAVAYHLVREAVARGEIITAYINTHDNIADLFTKPMTAGEKRNGFVRKMLYHIFRKE